MRRGVLGIRGILGILGILGLIGILLGVILGLFSILGQWRWRLEENCGWCAFGCRG